MNNMPITYLIASAMRGPDVESDLTGEIEDLWCNLKYHVTARIRAMYFDASECMGLYNDDSMSEGDYKAVIEWATKLYDREQPQLVHYLLHLSHALLEIDKLSPHVNLFGKYLIPLREAMLDIACRIKKES